MPKVGHHLAGAASALLCTGTAGVALHEAHRRLFAFDCFDMRAWRALWRGFLADQIVFDSIESLAFLASFPLALIAVALGMAPLARAIRRFAPQGRNAVLAGPPAAQAEIRIVPPLERRVSDPAREAAIAEELYRRLFETPGRARDGISRPDPQATIGQ